MWLLDVNLPTALARLLRRFGLLAETAVERGWAGLTNGALAEMALLQGFRVLLTRDRRFAASAVSNPEALRELAIVIVRLPQAREAPYLAEFESAWRRQPIEPINGAAIEWP
jgi:hypothetical protein